MSNIEADNISKTLVETAQKIVERLRTNINSQLGYNSKLADTLHYNITDNRLVITAGNYWDYAEKGRGPGGVPSNFETLLTDWASRKGLVVGNPETFAKNVKWKTIRDGSYLYRNPQEQRNFKGSVIDEEIENLVQKLPLDFIIIIKTGL